MSESQLDLSRLALNRGSVDSGSVKGRRRWLSRYVLPLGILLGFIGLLGSAAGRQWLPRKSVTVVPVIVKRGEVKTAGMPLFQAPGWIEPRPTAINVAALSPGVIDELLVVEGQKVSKGEPIARLVSIDAELAVQQAKANLAIREGELQRTIAEQKAATVRLANPVHLKAQVAEAQSALAKTITELEKLPFLIKAAQAKVDYTRNRWNRNKAAGTAIATVEVDQAATEYTSAVAELEELNQRQGNLQSEITALTDKVSALQEQLELLIEERRQVEEADAKVLSARAIRDEAELQVRKAELALERMVVNAPFTGRILRLVALPGTRVMGLEHNARQSSSTVVEMYDPMRLQVRADVRLEDVPLVVPRSPVEIETASSGKPLRGCVLRPTSFANVQKNTLEVKVELIDTPETIKPEMLVTATFLAPETESQSKNEGTADRIFVPEELVLESDNGAHVWTIGAKNQAKFQEIKVGQNGADGLVEVTQGLNVTDKLIASPRENLSEGDVVLVRGEDQSIGVGS